MRIYEGRSEASDNVTLVSLGAKEGKLECRTSRTVGSFEKAIQNELNLKVKVYTKDNWVKVLDGITLESASKLPNGMTKAKMEKYVSNYSKSGKAVNEALSPTASSIESDKLIMDLFKDIKVVDVTFSEVKDAVDIDDTTEYAYANFSAPAIGLIDYGEEWSPKAWVYVEDDPDEAMYPAFKFIKELKEDGLTEEDIFHSESSDIKLYGFKESAFNIKGTLGVIFNRIYNVDGRKPAYCYEWDSEAEKVLVRTKDPNWGSRMYTILREKETSNMDPGQVTFLDDKGFETMVYNAEHPENPKNIPLHFEELKEGELTPVQICDKYGYVNSDSQIVIPFIYDKADTFREGFATIVLDGKYGLINEKGEEIIAPQYDDISSASEGFVKVKLDDKYGFVDVKGNIVAPIQYESAGRFSEGLAEVEVDGMYGYIDTTGKIAIQPSFKGANSFKNGFAEVKMSNRKWGIIDVSGKVVIEPVFDESWDLNHVIDNIFTGEIDGLCGLIDTNNKWIIPPTYKNISRWICDGLMAVELDGKCGYINVHGEVVIPLNFDETNAFKNGIAEVSLDGETFKIDTKGNKIEE